MSNTVVMIIGAVIGYVLGGSIETAIGGAVVALILKWFIKMYNNSTPDERAAMDAEFFDNSDND